MFEKRKKSKHETKAVEKGKKRNEDCDSHNSIRNKKMVSQMVLKLDKTRGNNMMVMREGSGSLLRMTMGKGIETRELRVSWTVPDTS